jgi:5'-3' exonuclease
MKYISFEELRGKTIVVDVSIYLYKFKAFDEFLKLIKQMLMDFIRYGIHGIFVFDGKPKENKEIELIYRKEQKEKAWETYQLLKKDGNEEQLQYLKKQCTKININDVANVKTIMDSLGITYTVAPHEADEICAKLSSKEKVYACMSDDMDMLVYGCKRVLRNVNFETKTAILYKLDDILEYLKLSYDNFKKLCVISGTDYYKSNRNILLNLYLNYKHSKCTNLYDWLKINNIQANYELLETICQDFDISDVKYEYLNDIIESLV